MLRYKHNQSILKQIDQLQKITHRLQSQQSHFQQLSNAEKKQAILSFQQLHATMFDLKSSIVPL